MVMRIPLSALALPVVALLSLQAPAQSQSYPNRAVPDFNVMNNDDGDWLFRGGPEPEAARRGILRAIDELDTEFINGAWSGENLFEAAATLRVPRQVQTDEVRQVLENLSNELVADIALGEPLQPVASRERAPKPDARG